MAAWPAVSWVEAGQILDLVGDSIDRGEFAGETQLAPDQFFAGLIARQRWQEATFFLAHALPRYEGVVWAVQVLLESGAIDRAHPIMNASLRWVDDPSDALRREVKRLADADGGMSAACLLGLAIFVSGGSISEPELPPVLPAPDASAKLVAGALVTAAYDGDQPDAWLQRAAEAGKVMASQGYAR